MIGNLSGRVKTWLTAGAGTVSAVLIAGLLGAFGALQPPPLPEFAAGVPIESGQWRSGPLKAVVAGPAVYPLLKEGQKALILVAELTNRTRESSDDFFALFQPQIPMESEAIRPTLILVRDGQRLQRLHPGMTERVAYVWTLPDTTPIPDRLRFGVVTKTYKPMDNVKGKPGWFDGRALGSVTLPVETASPGTGAPS